MSITKYNLKRSQNKRNKKAINFVCSCISKKKSNKKIYSKKDPDLSEETYENEGTGSESFVSSLKGFNWKLLKIRKAKRTNIDPCTFRLKFRWDEEKKAFKLRDDSNLVHNHQPENSCNNNVSLNLI